MKEKVLFLYNWVPPEQKQGIYAECIHRSTVNQISQALIHLGYSVIFTNLLNREQLIRVARAHAVKKAFVLAEGFLDQPETLYNGDGAAAVRRVLEEIGVSATHSPPQAMELCRNKHLTYEVLAQAGLPIPRHFCFDLDSKLPRQVKTAQWQVGFPMFVKPVGGGNSIGIDEQSVVNNKEQLLHALDRLATKYGVKQALAETYLPGQEFTVGVIGNYEKYVLPVIGFPPNFPVRSNSVKKTESEQRSRFQVITAQDPRWARLHHLAVRTFEVLGAKGIIRIDLKEDTNGTPCIIDVNGTPSLSAKGSLSFMAARASLSYTRLIQAVLEERLITPGTLEETS